MLERLKHYNAWQWVCYFFRRLFETGLTYRAASLVYATLLSLVPLMIITLTVVSFFPHFHQVTDQMEAFVFRTFVTDAASGIVQHLDNFVRNVNKLSWINIGFLFLVCMLMIHNMRAAFNTIWGIREKRNYVLLMLVYLVVIVVAPPVTAALILGGAYIAALPYVHTFTDHVLLKTASIHTIPWVITFLVFWLLNVLLPACKVNWRAAAVGALLTTILFEILKSGFTYYLKMASTYQLVYGTLAAIPLFLIWLYLSWILVLLGAMMANILTNGLPKDTK
ncbi:MAG: YihY family inner membrane protein [Coxiellaceae bacterium]|nr:YihY family inner membrane protein [Coxiellaceae bacterium]